MDILGALRHNAEAFSGLTAVSDREKSLTWGELYEKASSLGSAIRKKAGTGKPVFVECLRSADTVAAFFAVVYSGNFYVPADLSLPAGRLREMEKIISPAAFLSLGGVSPFEAPVIGFSESAGLLPPFEHGPNNLLYVIFTSGSTGVPKGVSITHKNVCDMAESFLKVLPIGRGEVFGNQAPFDFDVSVKDIYISLFTGSHMTVLEKLLFSFPKLLIDRLNEKKVTACFWAVPAMRLPAAVKAFGAVKPESLRLVMFSGEVMPEGVLDYWRSSLPGVRFFNLYGPTEITCNCTFFEATDCEGELPVGRAFPGRRVFIRNGEICVSGIGLSPGYYGRDDLSKEAFFEGPYGRAYRTGDLGEMKDGLLFFRGRKDTQIKHMGHRIELYEIELCANRAGVTSACVFLEEKGIFLFYTGEGDPMQMIKKELPDYMKPAKAVKLDAFPAGRTGKIDRNALKEQAKKL